MSSIVHIYAFVLVHVLHFDEIPQEAPNSYKTLHACCTSDDKRASVDERERGRVRARPHEGEATNSRCVACTQRVNFPVESGSTSNINIATPTRILLLPPLLPLLLLFIFSAPVTRAFVRPTHYENQRTLAAMLCAYE